MRLGGTGTPVPTSSATVVPAAAPDSPGIGEAEANLHAGMLIAGRYRLVAPLGQGGMSEVWRGADENLAGRTRAIKRMLVGGVTPEEREERYAYLRREADTLARIKHTAICDIFD